MVKYQLRGGEQRRAAGDEERTREDRRSRRLNDTLALTGRPPQGDESHSISVKPIANGYVVCQSSHNYETGECKYLEEYVERPPILVPGRMKGRNPAPDQGNAMEDAVLYLGGRRT